MGSFCPSVDVPPSPGGLFLNWMLPCSRWWASHSGMAARDECFMWLRVNQVHIETLPGVSPSIKASPGAVKRFFLSPANVCGCATTIAISGPPHLLPLQRWLRLLLISLPTPLGSVFNMHSTIQPSLQPLTYSSQTRQGSCVADRHQIFLKRRRQTDTSVWLGSVMGDTVSMNPVLPRVKATDKFG